MAVWNKQTEELLGDLERVGTLVEMLHQEILDKGIDPNHALAILTSIKTQLQIILQELKKHGSR